MVAHCGDDMIVTRTMRHICSITLWVLFTSALSVGMAVARGDDVPLRPRLAVLELHNRSDYRGHMIGRRAADALYVALRTEGRWDLLERTEVRRACRDMDLEPPFAVGYQQALGHRLGADVILTGHVEEVRISAGDGTVTVGLTVDFADRICGQSIMPLRVSGSARRADAGPRPTDATVSEALDRACQQVAAMTRTVPKYAAQVESVSANELSLEAGRGALVSVEDRLLLYRLTTEQVSARLVGVLMVRRVEGIRAQATILGKAEDIYTGDIAVCVGPARQ